MSRILLTEKKSKIQYFCFATMPNPRSRKWNYLGIDQQTQCLVTRDLSAEEASKSSLSIKSFKHRTVGIHAVTATISAQII